MATIKKNGKKVIFPKRNMEVKVYTKNKKVPKPKVKMLKPLEEEVFHQWEANQSKYRFWSCFWDVFWDVSLTLSVSALMYKEEKWSFCI